MNADLSNYQSNNRHKAIMNRIGSHEDTLLPLDDDDDGIPKDST